MYNVSANQIDLTHLFDTPYLKHVIRAMHSGNSPATIHVDNPNTPTSALIWDQSHCLYLGGNPENSDFNTQLHEYFTQKLLVEAKNQQLGILKLYRTDDKWDEVLASIFQPLELQYRMRVIYSALPHEIQPTLLPDGYKTAQIDRTLLENNQLIGVENVTNEIQACWLSVGDFLQKGFGYCVINDANQVVAWCTAEYVSRGMCGVGIETLKDYQGRGLATAAANEFMRHAAENNFQVYWDSWLTNTPSTRVAEKVGFQKAAEYSISLVILVNSF